MAKKCIKICKKDTFYLILLTCQTVAAKNWSTTCNKYKTDSAVKAHQTFINIKTIHLLKLFDQRRFTNSNLIVLEET